MIAQMRRAEVYRNGVLAGILAEFNRNSYLFRYDDSYFNDTNKPAISLTLSKRQKEYQSDHMFPFFSNMVAEGANLAIQSRYLKIDERDTLGLLVATASNDSIGPITFKLIEP